LPAVSPTSPSSTPSIPGPALQPGPPQTSSAGTGPSLEGNGNTASPGNARLNPGLPIPVILGLVCGIVGFFIVLGCITAYCRRRNRLRAQREMNATPNLNNEPEKTD
jgi:hypothetical protein